MPLDLKQSESPLSSLVRRTSSRRRQAPEQPQYAYYPSAHHIPHSPLLHSHFARDSIATASSYDDNSNGVRSSTISRDVYGDHLGSSPDDHSDFRYPYFEDDTDDGLLRGPSLRDSWCSTATDATSHTTTRHLSNVFRPQQEQQVEDPPTPVPSVLVSLHDPPMNNIGDTGRILVVKPITNFSRPIREAGQQAAMGQRVMPQLPPNMREQKLKVLERNARRGMPSSPMYTDGSSSIQNGSSSGWSRSLQAEAHQDRSQLMNSYPQPPPMVSSNDSLHPPSSSETGRSVSPASLYSTYSYYEYDEALPSPQSPSSPAEVGSGSKSEQLQRLLSSSRSSSPRPPEGLRTPQEFLQLGIQHHEANRLQESARCFERSATEEGGCGVGMLMYGLTLRHGWGCARNEKAGFKWVRKAAEYAVEDLERVRMNGDMDVKVIETELVLAIYEVGQCFFHGWGVAKDQKMAVSYYTVAARLGDGDAQIDLGFCLANGKGCKKDKKTAAKWYRAAVSQGQSDVGLAWIYKQKYSDQVLVPLQ